MKRYTIDPKDFTASQWEELCACTVHFVPQTISDCRANARPFNRPKHQICFAIDHLQNEADFKQEMYPDDPNWPLDLRGAAEVLRGLLPSPRITRKEASKRLQDILESDIYTDDPAYADRVSEIYDLMPIVFGAKKKKGAAVKA